MPLRERRCLVCGCLADHEQTSAHLAKVMWFCTSHGTAFHSSPEFHAARTAISTADCWKAIDVWLQLATEALTPAREAA